MMTEDLEELRAKAEQGDAASQYQLGIRYFLGDGTDQNLEEAYKWISESAKQDHSDAMYTLGIMYRSGLGVKKDGKSAMEWFLRSAGKDNSYGHPHAEVLSRLKAVGARVLRTDESGTIRLYSDGENVVFRE